MLDQNGLCWWKKRILHTMVIETLWKLVAVCRLWKQQNPCTLAFLLIARMVFDAWHKTSINFLQPSKADFLVKRTWYILILDYKQNTCNTVELHHKHGWYLYCKCVVFNSVHDLNTCSSQRLLNTRPYKKYRLPPAPMPKKSSNLKKCFEHLQFRKYLLHELEHIFPHGTTVACFTVGKQ